MEKVQLSGQESESRKAYNQPKLVKQGRVEDITRDILENIVDCSKPV